MSMPRKALPRIVSVAPGAADLTLTIKWNTGEETLVDVSGITNSFRFYAPLRQSPELFRRVRVGEHGADIVWNDDLDMSNDTLWRLAQEQSGATMSAEAFRHWRERRAYTLGAAARALGLSRRMIAYYEQGERPIPRVVALATRALEAAE
jgi:DNA-binding transcriptional regulator YiaG